MHLAVPILPAGNTDGGDALEMVSTPGDDGLLDVVNGTAAPGTDVRPAGRLSGAKGARPAGSPGPGDGAGTLPGGGPLGGALFLGAPTRAADRYVLALYESLAEGAPVAGAVRAAKLA